ncbi:alpha-glucan family phosphorylase, partial [Candidatus Woesebacteria bacterium]|nr:alpha-glucan family phosphorylase [Candidatus Woesebacteria bacterium]
DSNIPTYAGGLGILAADTLLQAADDNIPMVGIGMMYKGKRFIQKINEEGMQYEEPTPFRLDGSSCFRRVDVVGMPVRFDIQVGNETVWIEAYKQRLGDAVTLYLLTTDVEGNSDYWRNVYDEIYWGDDEEQIRERIIFGVGGMKLLSHLKVKPSVIHIQEGRPSLVALHVMGEIKAKNPDLSFEQILEETKKKIVYTNHTLVAAGIHSYDRVLVEKYITPIAQGFGFSTEDIIKLGLMEDGRFHTTKFALNVSHIASSVSTPHGRLAKKEYPGYNWVNITNGVYLPRWQQPEYTNMNIDDHTLWEIHKQKKHSLMREVTTRVGFGYDSDWLTISWARRVSGYKQLQALFADIDRLQGMLSDPARPIILLVAGKAHPGDTAGKELIQSIISNMKGKLSGHAMFVHNYDIALASELVSGSDVWVNTPEWGKEASGTSGMKAISNGVINATIPDGWAMEVDWQGTGWALDHENLTESLYTTIEKARDLYYTRNEQGIPVEWIQMMRKSIALAQKYSAKRMLAEYQKRLYS